MKGALSVLGRWAVFLLAAAMAALPAVFLADWWGYLPVLLLGCALALSLAALLAGGRKLKLERSVRDMQCLRGETVELGLHIRNHARLLTAAGGVHLSITELSGRQEARRDVRFFLSPGEEAALGAQMELRHIGAYSVGLEGAYLQDSFGLFRAPVALDGRFTVRVLPRLRTMEAFQPGRALAEAENETRAAVVGGTDYTGVREYALGDPMKQIHWKLSAHSQTYLTKLQESFRQQEFAVVLDLSVPAWKDREQILDVRDCLIETALSLLAEADREEAACSLLFRGLEGEAERLPYTGEAQAVELAERLSPAEPDPPPGYADACRLLIREGGVANRAPNVAVVTARLTPELTGEVLRLRRQRRRPEVYFVVPGGWNSRQVSDAAAPLRQLEGEEIPWYVCAATAAPGKGGEDHG